MTVSFSKMASKLVLLQSRERLLADTQDFRGSLNDEARDAVIGLDARWNLLFVVHIERDGEGIRIISARRATRQERVEYENESFE